MNGIGSTGKSTYESNIRSLQKFYPNIVKQLELTCESETYRLIYDKEARIYNLYNNEKQQFHYAESNPLEDIAAQMEQLKLKNTRIALLLGMGLGYELLYYLQQLAKVQNTTHMFIVEKNIEVFRLALYINDLVPIIENNNVHFMVGIPIDDMFATFFEAFRDTSYLVLVKTLKPVYLTASIQRDKEYYLSALRIVKESAIIARKYYGNSPQDSLLGIQNMFININEIIENPGINMLYDQFRGKPAIVVSTGPTLNKNKHLLKGLEDKAVIICADSALKILLGMGIKPHLVTMLERDARLYRFYQDIDAPDVQDVYLAATPVIDNKSYEVYPGPRTIVYRNLDHFKWLGIERGILDIKPSAGNMSFKIAEALGCDPIVLIGQDLAYGEEGNTHAKGVVFGDNQEEEKQFQDIYVKGNYTDKVMTHEVWYSFLKGYEADLADYNGLCINSTAGGAYIQGTVVMPFQEAIETYMQEAFHPLVTIKERFSAFTSNQSQSDARNVLARIEKSVEETNNIINCCNEGLNILQKYRVELEEYKSEKSNGDRKQLLQLMNEVIKNKYEIVTFKDTFQQFIMHIVQSFYIDFEIELAVVPERYENESQALAHQLLMHDKWYQTIKEFAKVTLETLEEGKDKAEASLKR